MNEVKNFINDMCKFKNKVYKKESYILKKFILKKSKDFSTCPIFLFSWFYMKI